MSWREVKRCDPGARELADRHYSRQTVGHREFMPPGETLVLVHGAGPLFGGGAVWGSSRNVFKGRTRLRCSIFRNESTTRSSDLIRTATAATYARWPSERLTTEVQIEAVKAKRHPGYAFRCAGWVTTRVARSKLKGGGRLAYLSAPPRNALDKRGELI